MAEPTSVAASWMGMKFLTLIAGFAGGVVSLSFIKVLTKWQGACAVLTGLACAVFFAPLLAPSTAASLLAYAPIGDMYWEHKIEAAFAFLFGITGMTIVPGFIAVATRFREDPLCILRWMRGRR
mgnify:CR=1 FL=1